MRKITFLFIALVCATMTAWAVDWSTVEWLPNSNEKYKLFISPNFGDQYGGKRVENGTNLWIGFPSAAFGNMSIAPNGGDGAWRTFALSNFPNKENEFTVECERTTYTFTVYYEDGTTGGGGGSTPDLDPEPTPSVSPYCSTEIGYMANPNADANSFILLSVGSDGNGHTIVNIKQDAAKNTAMFDYINIVGKKETGSDVATGGSDEMAIMFNTPAPDGDGNITFTLQWSTVGWDGRWQIDNITVPANAICENADPFPGEHTYCKYSDKDLKKNNTYAALTWETNAVGDVVITLSDGEGASGTHFRNVGFEFDGNYDKSWKVYSGTKHSVCEPASIYFNYEEAFAGGNTYALRKKNDVTLPSDAVVAFFGHAFSWRTDQDPNAYTFDKWFGYTYGAACPFLAAPTNVAIDGTNHITFDAVTNAQTYTASVYLNGIVKHRQVVNNGDVLTFQPYITGTYQVEVVADAEGYPTSDPSDAYDWELTAPAIVVGNSEYCEWALPKHNNQDANLTWETGDDGAITITLSPLSEQTAVFRAEGMKLSDFTVGAARTAASAYFNRSYTAGGTTVVLTLKDANIAPGLGEKIYFSGYIECKVQDQDTWPNPSLEYTYGSKCSGQKHVTVSVNNNEMGSATVDGVAAKYVDEGTPVTCVAVPASGYEFVNWTKGGVEVSTELTYTPTINTATDLVANFDYARTTYCHTAVTTNGGKKLYLTVGKGATEGTYQIKIYGSDELTITGINNANTAVNHIKYLTYDGNDVSLTIDNGGWSFEATGYGVISSAEIQPQTNHTWRDIWMWRPDLYIGTSAGEQNINAVLNQQNHFNWNSTCSDAEAPAFNKAEAEVLNESSVRLKIQATDNWGGLLTYTIAREAAEPIISNHASGEEFTQDVTGLTAGTKYTFTVTVSDGVNNANQNIVVTPMGDSEPPVMGEARLESNTWNSAIINVAATDNKGVTAYYVVEKAADYIATDGKITVEGLTAATPYTFRIKAKDAAGNISENQAEVSFTTDAHLLAPTTAATAPTWPANQVKSLYSNTYDFAPASLSSYNECWWNCPNMSEGNIDGNTYLLYDLYRNGIIGAQFAETSMSLMEKIHIDIWASAAGSIKFRPITNGGPNTPKTLNLAAQQWNSFDIDLSEYAGHDWSKVFQFAIEGYQDGGLVGEHISVDNIFFYRTTPPPADLAAPTNASASKVAEGFYSVKITAQAEDNSGAVSFKVLNGENILATGFAATGVSTTITVSSLTPGTNYNLNVIAYDEAGNEASPVAVATSTKALPSPAPTPNLSNKNVVPVFTDAMVGGKTDIHSGGWGETTQVEWLDIAEGDKVFYGQNFNFAGWHSWGAGIDATDMVYLHVDVYSLEMTSVNVTPISPGPKEGSATITLTPNAWTSYDVPLSAYDANNIDWANIFQFKFMHPVGGNELLIDNVYFWQQTTQTTPVMGGNEATGGWATFASPVKVAVPSGVTAYKAEYQLNGNEEELLLTSIGDVIPAGEGVILHGEADHVYTFSPTNDPAGDYTGNALVGCPVRTDITSVAATNDIFCLRYSELYSLTGFFIYSGQYIAAGKAYLPLLKAEPSSAPRRIRFVFREEQGTTGFDPTNAEAVPTTKFIENGQLYIRRGNAVYTIQGVRVK